MRIGVIINILIIFLIVFYSLLAGIMEYFIKKRIKAMNFKYSKRGVSKPKSNYHNYNPNSMLYQELRYERINYTPTSREYNDLLDYKIELPIPMIENEIVDLNSKIPNSPQ